MGHLSKNDFEKILASVKQLPTVYIETGCNRGDQLIVAADVQQFSHLYGIELDGRYAEEARKRVGRSVVHTGDTSVLLPKLLATLKQPVFLLLDAHYCKLEPPIAKSRFPLWDELQLIRDRPYADIVVVDDVHTFGKARDDLRYGTEPEWETVTGVTISAFLGAAGTEIGDGYVVRRPGRP